MTAKVILVINALVYLLLGVAFIFIPNQFIMSILPPLGEVFARALGGVFIGLSIISWYARDEMSSKLVKGIILGNMIAHFLQAGGDIYAIHRGFLQASGWISISIHLLLGILFFFVLFRIKNFKRNRNKS